MGSAARGGGSSSRSGKARRIEMAPKKRTLGRPVGPDTVEVFYPRHRFKSGARIVSVTIATHTPKGKPKNVKPLHRPKRRPWREG